MTSREIREKYIKFFESSPRNHVRIDPAPLVLENDTTTLFTSSGMQPLVPYLKGEPHPKGKRLVNSQPSFRAQDIEEIGDNRHTTFFEMLGNWSLGDYFKKEQLAWFWEFLTKELNLEQKKLYVSVFEGNEIVPKDEESAEIWKKIGIPENHIFYYGVDKNWWSRSGLPDKMPAGEIGGPDSEVFYDFGEGLGLHEKYFSATDRVEPCHPNCDCGRFLEIGNSVFIQYIKKEDGSFSELPQKNVDFGGGLERLVAATENEPDIFKIDLFDPMIRIIGSETCKNYGEDPSADAAFRIVVDHIRASVFLIKDGVLPANKFQGYVLRRLLRRSVVKLRTINKDIDPIKCFSMLANKVLTIYEGAIKDVSLPKDIGRVDEILVAEVSRFSTTLERGLKELQKIEDVDGKIAFDLYQSYGFPLELTEELFLGKGQEIDKEQFSSEFEKHKELSRNASAGMFKGGLAGDTPTTRKYHTATHLLHKALREVLGEHVQQAGSNITEERLRFDFKHTQALNELEIKRISELVNRIIDEDLPVTQKIMKKDEALAQGALAFFGEKYPNKVKVYTIGKHPDQKGGWFSKELCGGPHVEHTGEIGHVTITKEESAGSGIRRIYIKLI